MSVHVKYKQKIFLIHSWWDPQMQNLQIQWGIIHLATKNEG